MPDILELKLGDQVEKEAQIFNLTEVPLKVSLFQMLSFEFRDVVLDNEINSQFSTIQKFVEESITNENIGFLIEVRIYSNEFGIPYIPGGTLLNPIGIGTEPIDSLAEYKRTAQLTIKTDSKNLTNNSSYLWIVKQNGLLKSKSVDKTFYDQFNKLAKKEAERRELLGKWEQSLPTSKYKSVNVANYWIDVYQQNEKIIKDNLKIDEINKLNNEMGVLNIKANDLFVKYQEIEEKLAQQESYYSMLNSIKAVSSLIGSAIEIQKAYCSDKAVAKSNDNSSSIMNEKMEFKKEIIKDGEVHKLTLKTEFNYTVDKIYNSEARLKKIYHNEGIPLPNKDYPTKLK